VKSTLKFNDDAFIAFLRLMRKHCRNIRKEMLEIALHLKGQAMASTPQKEGHLSDAAGVEVTIGKNGTNALVFFDKEYALAMHEDVYNLGVASESKQASAPPGIVVGRKYLERPLMQNREVYNKAIAEAYKQKIKDTVCDKPKSH